MTQTFVVRVKGEPRMRFSADFSQGSDPLRLLALPGEDDDQPEGTSLTVWDAKYSPAGAVELLNEYCGGTGGVCVGPGEAWTVEAESMAGGV